MWGAGVQQQGAALAEPVPKRRRSTRIPAAKRSRSPAPAQELAWPQKRRRTTASSSRRPATRKQAARSRPAASEARGQPAAAAPSAADTQQEPGAAKVAAKSAVRALSEERAARPMPVAAEPVSDGDQCAPEAVAMSQMQQQPAGVDVPGHSIAAGSTAAEGTLPHKGGGEDPQAMGVCHAPAEDHMAASLAVGAEPALTSNGSSDTGSPAAVRDPTNATLAAVAHQAVPEAQPARQPSALRLAVSDATRAPGAGSTAALATTSAAAAAHKAHMRSAQAQLAARARWKKHRQNLSAAAPALTADVKKARQPAVQRRTRAQRVSSAAADQPADEGTCVRMVEGTYAAAPGRGRLPAPEKGAWLPAPADANCDVQQPAGDSELGNATDALHRLSLRQQAAARAGCYWLHPPWMADHPPPPHLQVRHTSSPCRHPA